MKRTAARDKFGRLARYITRIPNLEDPSIQGLASYLIHGRSDAAVGLCTSNCVSDDLFLSVKEIEATQAMNTRARGDKTYHLVISFPDGERPTREQLSDIEATLVAAIGLGEHQRISVVHTDTDNLHVHVAINKIHPHNLKMVEPYQDHPKLMRACIELEYKHELIKTEHGHSADRKLSVNEQKMRAHSGRESLRDHIRDAWPKLQVAVAAAASWNDIHAEFGKYGLMLKRRGAGLAVAVPEGTSLKASDISRDLSLRSLEKRLGEFRAGATRGPEASQQTAGYSGSPRDWRRVLYKRYLIKREASQGERAAALGQARRMAGDYYERLEQTYGSSRMAARANVHLFADERRTQLRALAHEISQDRKAAASHFGNQRRAITERTPSLTWTEYLRREAESGNKLALEALRATRVARSAGWSDRLAPSLAGVDRHLLLEGATKVSANGDVAYVFADGGELTDRAGEVRIDRLSATAASVGLHLAKMRFGERPLEILGTPRFESAVLKSAIVADLPVTFADERLERARQEGHAEKLRPAHPEPAAARSHGPEVGPER